MSKISFFTIIYLVFLFFSCDNKDCCDYPDVFREPTTSQELMGTWLLYESGYSPGGGYITNPVNADPPQTIQLKPENEFSSTMQGLTSYNYYFILQDTFMNASVLSLYKTLPSNIPEYPDTLGLNYTVGRNESEDLILYFRFCIEGCHMAFRKID